MTSKILAEGALAPSTVAMDALSYFALAIIFFVVLVLCYGMIAIHDIPYLIAKGRNHPHQDAIHAGGWVSLFTLHAIWPFLWLWATAYHPEYGYAGRAPRPAAPTAPVVPSSAETIAALEKKIQELEAAAKKSKVPAPEVSESKISESK